MNARFTITLPDELNDRVEEIAKKNGLSKIALIHQITADFIGTSDDPNFFIEVRKRLDALEKEVFKKK